MLKFKAKKYIKEDCTKRVLDSEFVAYKYRLSMAYKQGVRAQHQPDKMILRSLRTASFRNMHGHYWSLRTRNSKAFPLSPFCRILETSISAWTFLASNTSRILFMSWIRLRSLFRTKLTTMDFRPDEQMEAMRRL